MNNRVFYGIIILLIAGMIGYVAISPHKTNNITLTGVISHPSQGEKHIAEGAAHEPYNSDLPSSGPHYQDATAPAQWGVYTEELRPEVYVHNEEHGGVVIAYKPSLPADQIRQLQKLFASPSSDKSFSAGKYILMPRPTNKQPIELASWTHTYSLNSFDKDKIEAYYRQNVTKLAPEPRGGPINRPINQAQ